VGLTRGVSGAAGELDDEVGGERATIVNLENIRGGYFVEGTDDVKIF
jgi:hypothetical protein